MSDLLIDASRPWWRMQAVDPGAFALLRVEDAALVLWNLCSAHGDAAGIISALEALRETHTTEVIDEIMADLA